MKDAGLYILRAALACLLLVPPLRAMEPPPDGYAPSGRKSAADLRIGNEQADPALAAGLAARLSGRKSVRGNFVGGGLPASGSPNILVLLVDFDDYPARPQDTPEAFRERVFGAGGAFPYESLTAYYRRSSFGRLNIQGDVYGWIRAGKRSEVKQDWRGRQELLKRALLSLEGVDFSKYDNNNDGYLDYVCLVWAGPAGEWGSFWWGYAPTFQDNSFTVSGKKLRSYSWQWVTRNWADADSAYDIRTMIHETGHSLGLPDYYDYKAGEGPEGGVGKFDMMDSTNYDHNCFSKLLLNWLTPRYVTVGGTYALKPASEGGDCVMLVPPSSPASGLGEFFLVERRTRAGNDSSLGHDGGVVIWHVDAAVRPQGGFLYNNQNTAHKLLKFVEADGLEELESGARKTLTAEDFFRLGARFASDTRPSSALYTGAGSGVSAAVGGGGAEVSLWASIVADLPQPALPADSGARPVTFTGWPASNR